MTTVRGVPEGSPPDLFVGGRDVALVAFFALFFGETELLAEAVAPQLPHKTAP